jgi:hypothetical protein
MPCPALDAGRPRRAAHPQTAALLLLGLTLLAGCGDDREAPPAPSPAADSGIVSCDGTPGSCPADQVCRAGVCESVEPIRTDAGSDAGPAPEGRVAVSPESIDFGAFALGVSVTRTLTVENRGDGPLRLLQLEVESDPKAEFVVVPGEDLPATIPPGERLAVQVTYTARDGASDRTRLRVITDDPRQPTTNVPLVAEYKGLPELALVVDPRASMPEVRTLDFGQVTLTSTRTLTVFVKNVGDGNAVLSVASARVEPTPSLNFEVETSTALPAFLNRYRTAAACTAQGACDLPDTRCTMGACVDRAGTPVDTLALTIAFSPNGLGALEETLVLSSDDGDGDERTVLVRLVGEGIQASLDVSPNPIELGTVFVGFPVVRTVELRSAGGDLLELRTIELVGAPQGVRLDAPPALPRTLAPGQVDTLTIVADPTGASPITGNLRITSSDPVRPERLVPLGGESLFPPVARTSTPAITFGQVHVLRGASPGYVRTLRLTNAGGSPLAITSIGFGPGASPDVSVSPTSVGGALQVNDGIDLTLRYEPRVIGPDTATLVVTTNDPLTPRLELPVTGEGIDPTLFLFKSTAPPVPASPIDFGGVYRGARPAPVTLTLQNTGVGPLVVQSIALTAGSSPELGLARVPALPATIPAGQALSVDVTYAPAAVGQDVGAVELRTSDLDLEVAIVNVLGEGVGCPTDRWDVDNDPANGCEYTCTQRVPPVELCNGVDDDCDRQIDEGFDLGTACDGTGACGAGRIECAARDPSRSTCSTNPGQSQAQDVRETCNTVDDDCDGTVDDGFDLTSDAQNCGRCGTTCSASNGTAECRAGQCAVAGCATGYADCDGQYANGCEVDTRSSAANCGACNRACTVANGDPVCANGTCGVARCNAGFFDCNARYADGCEANLNSDVATCGSCSTTCTAQNGTPACVNRQCTIASCVAPWSDCNGSVVDGCEANTAESLAHCGACGRACSVSNGTAVCAGGTCGVGACSGVFRDCNGSTADGCETNVDTSVTSCGSCGRACSVANGTPLCAGGACGVASCTAPFSDCNGAPADGCEANLSNSVATCGGCNVVCTVANGAPLCAGGVCGVAGCTAPWADCDGQYTNGCEANTQTSLAHCGGCNVACTVANGTPTCNAGSCQIAACTGRFRDCNRTPTDGCEIDIDVSNQNCGGCGNVCALANASSSCNGAGACRVDACVGRFRDCNGLPVDGCEIDSGSSLAHCGGCNQRCDIANATETCNAGVCTFGACAAGFVNLDGNPANGCEYACTFSSPTDVPDDGFVDANCDGIDGEVANAIFVSPRGLAANDGSRGAPVRTIAQAVTRAQARGVRTILVAAGFYSGPIDLPNGYGVYGGYSPDDWSRAAGNNAVIEGGFDGTNLVGVRVRNVNLATVLDRVVINVGNNTLAGGSVYGVHVVGASSLLRLSNLRITTGDGGAGLNGLAGNNGPSGGAGGVGSAGCDGCSGGGNPGSGGASACGRAGGTGGFGGYDNNPGDNGSTPAVGGAGGGGGEGARVCASGACSTCRGRAGGANGGGGAAGGFAGTGGNGAGGSGAGAVVADFWAQSSGASGADGTAGAGGGGGGGGGPGRGRAVQNQQTPRGTDDGTRGAAESRTHTMGYVRKYNAVSMRSY